jgi:hypothetical protein
MLAREMLGYLVDRCGKGAMTMKTEDAEIKMLECLHCHRLFNGIATYVNHCFERDPKTLVHVCPPRKEQRP